MGRAPRSTFCLSGTRPHMGFLAMLLVIGAGPGGCGTEGGNPHRSDKKPVEVSADNAPPTNTGAPPIGEAEDPSKSQGSRDPAAGMIPPLSCSYTFTVEAADSESAAGFFAQVSSDGGSAELAGQTLTITAQHADEQVDEGADSAGAAVSPRPGEWVIVVSIQPQTEVADESVSPTIAEPAEPKSSEPTPYCHARLTLGDEIPQWARVTLSITGRQDQTSQ